MEEKSNNLHELWMSVFTQVSPVLKILDKVLDEVDWKRMPWNIKRTAKQLVNYAHQYLVDVSIFMNRGIMEAGKRISFHLDEVACFNKGKIKGLQFGRAYQLGRVGGNFLIVGKSTSIRMDDKSSVQPMIETHQELFGKCEKLSIALDKGYYSKNNKEILKRMTGETVGLQIPGVKEIITDEEELKNQMELVNRRAGIEPLIGHAKHGWQLCKSRMKYDKTTESSGYASILGFNSRQLIRYLRAA